MATDQELITLLGSESFLTMRGLSNEVPFFIYPFDPTDALNAEKSLRLVSGHLRQDGIDVVTINLFDLCLELLEERGLLNPVLKAEPRQKTKSKFTAGLQSMLDVETMIAPRIAARSIDHRLVIVHGIGAVFPFIRTHALLEALQIHMPPVPLVLWFPGQYTKNEARGYELKVLNIAASDSYYRAKNIEEMIRAGL
ncbi:BREX protein BrxB domain-containing protein [Rothia sp. 11273D007AR]